jgi:purine-binding chemotaxis protein CheW
VTDADSLLPDFDQRQDLDVPRDEAIVVRLGSGRFAVELASVVEVGRVPAVTRLPGVPGFVAGVANWRGRILPVLDVRPLLGASATPTTRDTRLVILTADSLTAGMVADAVEGTTSLDDVAPIPVAGGSGDLMLVSGQAPRDEGPLAVLDVAAVMRLRHDLPRGRRTA